MGRIRVLDNLLVNKIAAGEVIERPASVVKELIENAIDARAANIGIEVEDGGRRLIRIIDDGDGMSRDDVQLAVTPHATSKITSEEDLSAIGTMGFRGEALASIGSVAQLRLTSRPAAAGEGYTIAVAGDRIDGPEVTGCAPGTTVEVRQLFFNVPARQKFLRGATTEMGHIVEQVTRTALGHRHVGFTIKHNGRETHRLPATDDTRRRIGELFSNDLAEDLIGIHRDERGLRIEGWIALPSRSRSSGKWQYVLLNGRYIRDRFVQHAVKEAYRGLVDVHNFPVVFLFVTIDPAAVDVNVHPTKIEVRWRDSGLVHSQVLSALRETLLARDLTGSAQVGDRPAEPPVSEETRQSVRQQMAEFFKNADPSACPPTPSWPAPPAAEGSAASGGGGALVPGPERPGGIRTAAQYEALYRPVAPGDGARSSDRGPSSPDDALPGRASALADDEPALPARAIQLHNTYLVAETDDGLIIVDQHALHERVLYDELRRRLERGALESQRLLLPETVEATEAQMALLETHAELLRRLGFELSPFGRNTAAVHAAPSLLPDVAVRDFVAGLLDRLSDLPAEPEELMHTLLDMMACKAAVKAGDPLTAEEVESLLRRGADVEKGSNCPHGRPTTLRLSVRDLEKQFHRT